MRIGQRLKQQLGMETEEERKKRVAQEKKEIEINNSYFKKISQVKEQSPISSVPTEALKTLIWRESKNYFKQRGREFQVDGFNKDFLHLVSLYFSNNPKFESEYGGELRKGLFVYGTCGTGKSSIFDVIQIISKKYKLPYLWFKNVSVHNVITNYNLEGEYVVEKHTKGKVHFDDLGAEKLANSWGVKEKLMIRILEIRYNEFKAKATKTFITSNLNIQDVKKEYGDRVYSRFYEMFNFLELKGNDRRF
ncbi:hypothetical protein HBA12_07035 [Tenacibaculum mesophilum]|uniref:hypothetical protein n=1 Tax=Tenacibaculum mesophilum TaxID=104268 RepID=UPI00142F9F0E|nr:hypothetical protein [Tenacibaculum mesophilum]KAF9659983.1 hypothetical protein HBA12_07035 [Tenacibaculum mesophilum]